MESKKDSIHRVTSAILNKINTTIETSRTKALLANIRNSINKNISNNIESMSYLFSNLPEEFLEIQLSYAMRKKQLLLLFNYMQFINRELNILC